MPGSYCGPVEEAWPVVLDSTRQPRMVMADIDFIRYMGSGRSIAYESNIARFYKVKFFNAL